MKKNTEYKKNCTQVKTPEVDNSSPCEDFMLSECVIMDRKSDLIRGSKGMTMNEYTLALETEIRLLKIQFNNIKLLLDGLEIGIGVYED